MNLLQLRTRVAEFLEDEATCLWVAPVPYPSDGSTYNWSEDDSAWLKVNP